MASVSMKTFMAVGAINVAWSMHMQGAKPIEKAHTLVSDLRDKLVTEGESEATTYEKFACFCKDTITQKTSDITTGETNKDALQADLNGAILARDNADTAMGGAQDAITALQNEIKNLTATRHTELMKYEKEEIDLTLAMQGLDSAIQSLKAAKVGTSFLELQAPVLKTINQAISHVTSVAGISALQDSTLAAIVQLQQHQSNPYEDYSFKSDDIISTLETLKTSFRDTKTKLDDTETTARQTYNTQVQSKEASIKTKEGDLDTQKQAKATQVALIASTSKDLTTTSSQLMEDKAYLSDLSAKCQDKAQLWDKRSNTRQLELSALTEALTALDGMLAKANANSTTLISVKKVASAHRMAQIQTGVQAVATSFVQTREVHHHQSADPADRRSKLTALLKMQATKLQSAQLLKLAQESAEDPFAKVKVLIQALIERLLKEAAEEANHKGWCDKEVAVAEQSRDYAASAIKELNGELALVEAREGQLTVLVRDLTEDIAKMEETYANSSALRVEEKAEHEQAIKDAEEGKNATETVIDILEKFYKEAAKNASSFAQMKNTTEAPDAGFDGEYAGAQGGKEGVLGLLEVILSDYQRAITETTAQEEDAVQKFNEFETTLNSTKAEKKVALTQRSQALNETKTQDTDSRTKMGQEQELFEKSLGELIALHAACFPKPMTAEERKIKRDEELGALKQALCILDDGNADSCL